MVEKAPDEVYCGSCGEAVKKRARVCPNCGVKNERYSEEQQQSSSSHSSTTQTTTNKTQPDPSKSQPTGVSEEWYYGVAVSLALWMVGFGTSNPIAGLAFISAWTLMPLSIYFDTQWVTAKTHWQPNSTLWIGLAAFPAISIPAGAVYLIQRYNAERSTETNYAGSARETDTAIEQLRERYSRGEISDEEFEQRVERLVGTEDGESVKKYTKEKTKD